MKAPEGIGSILSFECAADSHPHSMILGPSVMDDDPPTVVPSITEYFKWLLETKHSSSKIGTAEEDLGEARSALNRLEKLVLDWISGYDTAILRCIPSHEDFGAHNVLVDASGLITAVLDWEFHMVQPAVLGVSYPSWIRYDGCYDPRFIDPHNAAFEVWFTTRADAAKLREIYDEVIQNFFESSLTA